MSRQQKHLPRYLRHSSGKARAVWNDPVHGRREQLLPGKFDSSESLQTFARIQLELTTTVAIPKPNPSGLRLVDVLLPYIQFAVIYYGKGAELEAIKATIKVLRELYGMTLIADFGPKKLAAVREAFISKGWSRTYVNRQTQRIVRAFRWAVAEELVPATIYQALKALNPLRSGKSPAPETQPRLPVPAEDVAKTLPYLPPHVRVIIELMRFTGMRPSEVCRMTLGEIDRTGTIWKYQPRHHKNQHRGHFRLIALGSSAQSVLNEFLTGRCLGETEPLFSPQRQREERYVKMRKNRKTKVQPSQVYRRKTVPKKMPGTWFSTGVLTHAVAIAAKKAGVVHWSPYQLRHLRAAELRGTHSLEHVRAALGHSHAAMSAHYARGADEVLALEVAANSG